MSATVETLEFTTPTTRTRDAHPITVDHLGDELTIRRPKDWVLLSAQTAMAENITDTERALAIVQFLLGTLGQQGYARYLNRTLDRDDPVNFATTIELIAGLLDRWGNYTPETAAFTVEPQPRDIHGEPARVVNDDLAIDLEFHPPKDVALMIFAATATSTEDYGQQWAVEYFVDATLTRTEAMTLKRRLRMPNDGDPLDVEHLDPIMESLLTRWQPVDPNMPANREQRRAQSKKTGSAKSTTRKTSTQ